MSGSTTERARDGECYVCGASIPPGIMGHVRVYGQNGAGGARLACSRCVGLAGSRGVQTVERDGRLIQFGPLCGAGVER